MNEELETKISALFDEVVKSSNENTVRFQLTINSEGAEVDFETRTAESLKRDGISMRNLKGDFIR